MVITVSSMLHKDESLDKEAGGSTATVGSTNSSVVGSLDVGGLDAPVEDSTLGYWSYDMYGLRCGKIL